MKTCALCALPTTPLNGSTTSADAVLCPGCLEKYKASSEFRRAEYFEKEGSPGPARTALTDFLMTTQKIAQEEASAEKKAKEEAEKKAKAAVPAPNVAPAKS